MTTRPRWVTAIAHFITDEVVDDRYGFPMDGSDDDELDQIGQVVLDKMCELYGHEVIDDMCGKPEHRYCAHCNRREAAL